MDGFDYADILWQEEKDARSYRELNKKTFTKRCEDIFFTPFGICLSAIYFIIFIAIIL